jgi:hypothetical protein
MHVNLKERKMFVVVVSHLYHPFISLLQFSRGPHKKLT